MGAIVGIYIRLNGMTMARSGTLLTLANMLGKVASAALIIPTSEALGQLKWNWFHNSNAIWDFELFDKASRGAWGAALLLFRTKGRSLAALGALLILLLLAIDTFFQQVVVFPDKQTLHATRGEIPRVVYYDPIYLPEFTGGFETSPINTDTAPIVEQFFYGNGTQQVAFGTGVRPEVPLVSPRTFVIKAYRGPPDTTFRRLTTTGAQLTIFRAAQLHLVIGPHTRPWLYAASVRRLVIS
jgi:hypothetical protein